MTAPRFFVVNASHVSADYAADRAVIEVRADGDKFYASESPYGCGKSRATPEAAIRELLENNGCTRVEVVRELPTKADFEAAIRAECERRFARDGDAWSTEQWMRDNVRQDWADLFGDPWELTRAVVCTQLNADFRDGYPCEAVDVDAEHYARQARADAPELFMDTAPAVNGAAILRDVDAFAAEALALNGGDVDATLAALNGPKPHAWRHVPAEFWTDAARIVAQSQPLYFVTYRGNGAADRPALCEAGIYTDGEAANAESRRLNADAERFGWSGHYAVQDSLDGCEPISTDSLSSLDSAMQDRLAALGFVAWCIRGRSIDGTVWGDLWGDSWGSDLGAAAYWTTRADAEREAAERREKQRNRPADSIVGHIAPQPFAVALLGRLAQELRDAEAAETALNASDCSTIGNYLSSAASQFREYAATLRGMSQDELAERFERQAREADGYAATFGGAHSAQVQS